MNTFFSTFFRIFASILRIEEVKMKAKKVLFITQEIVPYLPESQKSNAGRRLPQSVQESGREIRTFMPKWGNINERRNQLHEVIRLSGMNLIIDDTDHPLIIKVASIQPARMQVYFIDNDDYFQNVGNEACNDEGIREENDCRAIFYARGVLETVKKLRWCPDVIHCHGWISALAPLYIKKAYREEPSFMESKVVFSLFDDSLAHEFSTDFPEKLLVKDLSAEDLEMMGDAPYTKDSLAKLAMEYSDGVMLHSDSVTSDLLDFASSKNIPVVNYEEGDEFVSSCLDFYDRVWSTGKEE